MEQHLDVQPLNNMLKHLVENSLNNWDLTDYALGTVVSEAPLRVKLHDKLTLEQKDLLLTTAVTDDQLPVECSGAQGFVKNALTVGDRLVLLKAGRGQTFVVLGKVVQ
ncbi:MAG: DUF2577 family protein [Bacillota bacterium]